MPCPIPYSVKARSASPERVIHSFLRSIAAMFLCHLCHVCNRWRMKEHHDKRERRWLEDRYWGDGLEHTTDRPTRWRQCFEHRPAHEAPRDTETPASGLPRPSPPATTKGRPMSDRTSPAGQLGRISAYHLAYLDRPALRTSVHTRAHASAYVVMRARPRAGREKLPVKLDSVLSGKSQFSTPRNHDTFCPDNRTRLNA